MTRASLLCFLLFATGLFTPGVALALDQDGDNVSDVYAAHYGLDPGVGNEDPDGDGQTTTEESA